VREPAGRDLLQLFYVQSKDKEQARKATRSRAGSRIEGPAPIVFVLNPHFIIRNEH